MQETRTQKITPFLWFDGKAEEAARFYTSSFAHSEILEIARFPEGTPGAAGSVMTVRFRLDGETFVALNGGPMYAFTPAVSFVIDCATQAEVDRMWDQLTDGGEPGRCGWLKDRFGVSWQVVPAGLGKALADPDPTRAKRAAAAMMTMDKLDIHAIERARDR